MGPVPADFAIAAWAAPLLDLGLKATLLLGLARLATWLLRRQSAAIRYWALSLAFAGLLALPVASALLPAWTLPLPDPLRPDASSALSPRERIEETLLPLTGTPAADEHAVDPSTGSHVAADAPSAPPWSAWLVYVWMGGALLLTTRLLADQIRLLLYVASARPLATPEWRLLIDACARRAGLDRPVRVMISRHVATPMTFGVGRPVILLPHAFADWSLERWEVVLMHEMTHIRRRDYLTNLVAVLGCAMYWCHPLVWTAARRLRIERERACDDALLRRGLGEVDYAEHLLAVARLLVRRPGPSTIAMTRRSGLRIRIQAILDPHTRRQPFGWRPALASAAAAGLLVAGLGTAHVFAPSSSGPAAADPVSSAELLEALHSPDALLQEEAALALGKARIGDASPALIGMLRDADAGVRGLAAWALGNIGAAEAVPALAAQVWDQDDFAREMAIRALARIGDEEAVCPLARARRAENARTRAAVVWALGRIANPSALRAIALSLEDNDPFVRQVAEDALVFARNDRTDCILRELMEQERPELRPHLSRVLDRRRAAGTPHGRDFLS